MTSKTVYNNLNNKCVFITGGASGIGAAMVAAFLAQGSRVAFIDNNDQALSRFSEKLSEHADYQFWYKNVDVTDLTALKNALNEAGEAFAGIDILINNVANDTRHHPLDITEQDWNNSLSVNLNPAFFASQQAAKFMQRQSSGVIINISSINAIIGLENMVAYSTAKAGLIGMTKSLARDFGSDNIRVNAILPGWVATEKQLASYLTEEQEQKWTEAMAIKQRITPEHITDLALFLASDSSAMITGQCITIDGGRT